ncbi:MAG: molybdenum cofactor biosynthesis protein MoaE [Planctomycetes bacterium]|nr:molybdenum cofactor biosynthesis protein MoaE [Planctomycetota bacterium]
MIDSCYSNSSQRTPIRRSAIVDEPLDSSLLSSQELCVDDHGAIASFIGIVRNNHFNKGVSHLFYDCYQEMAQKVLDEIINEAVEKFDQDLQAIVVHGTGTMYPGDASVCIHVSSGHRVAAFDACRHIIERIKEDLPIWKQEFYSDNTNVWLKGS